MAEVVGGAASRAFEQAEPLRVRRQIAERIGGRGLAPLDGLRA